MGINLKKMTAKQVRAAREKLGFTNPAFSAALGVAPRTVVLWQEMGASQLGSLAIRYLLAFDENAEGMRNG